MCFHNAGNYSEGLFTIEKKIKFFEDRFIYLRITTCKELAVKGLSPQDLRITLTSLPKAAADQHKRFIIEKYHIFEKAETVEEIFSHLNFYLSFLNYNLLVHVIKHFGSKNLQLKMKSYCKDIELFQKETMIADILPYLPQESTCPKDHSRLELKVNIDITTTSLDDLEQYRKQFANEFLLPDFALLLADLKKSSLLIVWFVPSAVVSTLKLQTKMKKFYLFSIFYITVISVDGAIIGESLT